MKSTESDVCYFEVDAVFNREPVELLEESMWTAGFTRTRVIRQRPCALQNGWTDQDVVWGVESWGPGSHELDRRPSRPHQVRQSGGTYCDVPSGRYTQSDSQGAARGDAACSTALPWQLVLCYDRSKCMTSVKLFFISFC